MPRFYFLAFALTLTAAPALAQNDICAPIGGIAENIMAMRQQERAISDVIASVTANTPEATQPIIREMILQAYERPAFSTKERQQHAVAEFRNQIELACYRMRLQATD